MLKRKKTKTKIKKESNLKDISEISEDTEETSNKSEKCCETKCDFQGSTTGIGIPTNKKTKQRANKCSKTSEKCHKEVHFAFLPERYEPLIEDDEETERNKEKRQKKKERNKKYRKNLGKALRFSWKCLVAGLQSFAAPYSMPISAVAPFVSGFHETRTKG